MVRTTETILNEHELTWQDLYTSRYAFDKPFQLTLEEGDTLFVEKVIRLVPRRRMTVFGTWKGKKVAAKIFYHPKRKRRHVNKELNGVNALVSNNVPTPRLHYHASTKDKRSYVLIFEQIINATTVDEIWHNGASQSEIEILLKMLILELATQHVLGIIQKDLHLRNFLLSGETLYTLDLAEIDVYPPLLSKQLSMQNLALLFSQLGVEADPYLHDLFNYYAKNRGWLLKNSDHVQLKLLVKQFNEKRWQRYQKKILRESTNCVLLKDLNTTGIVWRDNNGPEFAQFIKNPNTIFDQPEQILKLGHSATVIKATLDGQQYVIKRYNIKNFWHFLRRSLRPTRAFTSWRLAQKLKLYGIPTATPIGFFEKRFFGLRRQSYYITEYIHGEHAGYFFNKEHKNHNHMIQKISHLLKNLMKAEITHGDLKISNILIDRNDKPTFIDLDGATEHISLSGIRKAWQKEVKRFLRNFDEQPVIKEQFKATLIGTTGHL